MRQQTIKTPHPRGCTRTARAARFVKVAMAHPPCCISTADLTTWPFLLAPRTANRIIRQVSEEWEHGAKED